MNARRWTSSAALVAAFSLAGAAGAADVSGARVDDAVRTQPDATPTTSFDQPSAMDRPVTLNAEPDAASRSSNGAVTGAVADTIAPSERRNETTSPEPLGAHRTPAGSGTPDSNPTNDRALPP